MARTAFEQAVLSGVNLWSGAKSSDGSFPHNFWVSPNGNDGLGNGADAAPFLTNRRAIREARDGRGDRILTTPGSYAETIDIGSGTTDYGSNGSYLKRNIALIGQSDTHDGITQIIGDGATAAPTIRVRTAALRGFTLKNLELDTNGLARPCLRLETDDSGASPSAISSHYRFLIENVAVRSDDPSAGFIFQAATLGEVRNCFIHGPAFGIGFSGPSEDLRLVNIDFKNCVTADIATETADDGQLSTPVVANQTLTNVTFERMKHWDRGGTPVTNYINFNTSTMVNTHFFDCFAARDIGVSPNTLIVLPAGVVWLGHSAGGVETIVGV